MRTLVALLLLVLAGAPARAEQPSPAAVKKALKKALDERDIRARASAVVKALSGADDAKHAKTVADLVLDTEQPAIVKNVGVVMLGRMTDPEALPAMLTLAEKGSLEQRAHVVRAIGRLRISGATRGLLALHELRRDADLAPATLSALAERDDLGDHEALVRRAAVAGLSVRAWPERSAAARLAAASRNEHLGVWLCQRMKVEDGRIVDDFTQALERITGKRWGADPDRYMSWLSKKEDAVPDDAWEPRDFTFDSPLVATRSRRILFVLSRSISMADDADGGSHADELVASTAQVGEDLAQELRAAKTKIEVARVHLRVMLRSLHDGVRFDVMTYASSPSFAFGQLTESSPRTRKKAENRVASLSASGDADIYGALRRAFDPKGKDPLGAQNGPDTIVLLTDGNVQEPYETDREEIQRAVDHWKRTRQVVIHVVAVGQSLTKLLGPLAHGAPAGSLVSVP